MEYVHENIKWTTKNIDKKRYRQQPKYLHLYHQQSILDKSNRKKFISCCIAELAIRIQNYFNMFLELFNILIRSDLRPILRHIEDL